MSFSTSCIFKICRYNQNTIFWLGHCNKKKISVRKFPEIFPKMTPKSKFLHFNAFLCNNFLEFFGILLNNHETSPDSAIKTAQKNSSVSKIVSFKRVSFEGKVYTYPLTHSLNPTWWTSIIISNSKWNLQSYNITNLNWMVIQSNLDYVKCHRHGKKFTYSRFLHYPGFKYASKSWENVKNALKCKLTRHIYKYSMNLIGYQSSLKTFQSMKLH